MPLNLPKACIASEILAFGYPVNKKEPLKKKKKLAKCYIQVDLCNHILAMEDYSGINMPIARKNNFCRKSML